VFETLTERLQDVFRTLGRRGKLRESDIQEASRQIRLALLEADVHFQVVKDLLERVRQRALDEQVPPSLNPSQHVIRILQQELTRLLGEPGKLNLVGPTPRVVMLVGLQPTPRVVMLVGLQGSGKTTTAAKLGGWLRSRGERVWMVAADPYRPAAREQLAVLGEELDIPVYSDSQQESPDLCAALLRKPGMAAPALSSWIPPGAPNWMPR